MSIDGPKALVFIEVKVDADEGPQQLDRYAKALDELAGDRDSMLVFLTSDRQVTPFESRLPRNS